MLTFKYVSIPKWSSSAGGKALGFEDDRLVIETHLKVNIKYFIVWKAVYVINARL